MRRGSDETWLFEHQTAVAYRRASARNLGRLLALFGAVLAFLAVGAQEAVLAAVPHGRGLLVAGVFALLGAGVVWTNVALTRDCRRLGALCPRCGRQLIGPGHTMSRWTTRKGRLLGQCPACGVHLAEQERR
jgi:hypothetical protein